MDGNSAAYPFAYNYVKGMVFSDGITKRELIAAMAMQGLLADSRFIQPVEVVASASIRAADALIERLNANPAEGASNE
jgi:hypothetical protein